MRYRFVPSQPAEQVLDAAALKAKGPNYLQEEIGARSAAPIVFDWFAQVGEPGDLTDDPSIAWPESRGLAKLGTVEKQSKRVLCIPHGVRPRRECHAVRLPIDLSASSTAAVTDSC